MTVLLQNGLCAGDFEQPGGKDEARKMRERIGFFVRDLGSLAAGGRLEDFERKQLRPSIL
jgi:hypothetical protein